MANIFPKAVHRLLFARRAKFGEIDPLCLKHAVRERVQCGLQRKVRKDEDVLRILRHFPGPLTFAHA
jgi:hypothetical protein